MNPIIVSGIERDRIDVAALVDKIRRDDCGGLVVFEGTTRTPDEGRVVLHLDYEAYEERAAAQLEQIAKEVAERFGLGGVVAVHRVGRVMPSEPSVLVAAVAPHRAEAFEAARALIDRIKSEAYVWKKESTAAGDSWV
ncbi:MAG: molybdenum cofactor biosynthesis protein MoaE, partial [Actinomycetota bacterium]|nr:molybdenum cofactor biosynthesis protein MoaE [Actinomycetota bacterium]